MNFPPNTAGPGCGYELNPAGTCIKNLSTRTMVETHPTLLAVHGVIPAEAALLLLTSSAVFDRHPYPMPANAGKGKNVSLGLPGCTA
jgi:hypothetical protein